MELWYAPTSPFARKVRVAAHELGVADAIQLVEVDPWTDPRLRNLNPLAKVPTLVLDDGEIVWESGLIAERLDALSGAPALFPPAGTERWRGCCQSNANLSPLGRTSPTPALGLARELPPPSQSG